MPSAATPRWDSFRETAIGRQLLGREQAFLADALDAQGPRRRVLDLCSCSGRVSLPLRENMSSLVALDIDREGLGLFRERSGGLPAVAADGQSLPFADGSFDCIVALQCLRYFDQEAFLTGCHRALADDGWLVIQAVNRRGYKRRAKELARRSLRHHDTGTFSTEQTLRSVAAAGFEVLRVDGYNWLPIEADSGRFSDSWFVGPAGRLESMLGARHLTGLSPWILVAARKTPSAAFG